MPTKLTNLRFDQAANLVDDPANQHARIMLFKRRTATTWKPDIAVESKFKMPRQPATPEPQALATNNADEAKPRALRALATNGNEDNMTEMEKRQVWENVIQAWLRRSESRPVRRSGSEPPEGPTFYVF